MKVAIVGSRNSDKLKTSDIIDHLPTNCSEIVSGGAIGVDALAKEAAAQLGLLYQEILPNYSSFGKLAPLKRNVQIVDASDIVIAFWDMKSSGTRYVINLCMEQHKPIRIIPI